MEVVDKAYGYEGVKFSEHQRQMDKHVNRIKKDQGGGDRVKEHRHSPDTCRMHGCNFMIRDFRRQVYAVKKFIKGSGIIQRYGSFVTRVLNNQAYG